MAGRPTGRRRGAKAGAGGLNPASGGLFQTPVSL